MYKKEKEESILSNRTTTSIVLNVLFIHNSLPEYRIEFWKKLSEKLKLILLITNKGLEKKIYGLNKELGQLCVNYWGGLSDLKKKIVAVDCVILPPADTIKEYLIGLYALLICKKYGIRSIYWTEKWEADKKWLSNRKRIKNNIHRILISSLAQNCDECIAAGSKSKEYLEKIGIKERKITIAYDSSTSAETTEEVDFAKCYGIPNRAKVVLYLGRVVKRKGILVLLKAFKNVVREDLYLLICGEGKYKTYCEKWCKENKLTNVVFAGKIQPEKRILFYMRASVFVLPSILEDGVVEAWGLTVNEALEAGRYVIATDVVGSAYDLLDGKCGKIIKNNSVNELVLAMRNIDMDEETSQYCKLIAKKFSVEEMVNAFLKTIYKCTEKRKLF